MSDQADVIIIIFQAEETFFHQGLLRQTATKAQEVPIAQHVPDASPST